MRFVNASAILLLVLASVVAGEEKPEAQTPKPKPRSSKVKYGVVVVSPTSRQRVRGRIRMVQEEDKIHLSGKLNNLAPGKHSLVIHRYGDMRSRDGGSTGKQVPRGELGEIKAGENGVANFDFKLNDRMLDRLVGRSIVVIGDEAAVRDDPTGKTGPAVAVGVIGIGNIEWTYLKDR